MTSISRSAFCFCWIARYMTYPMRWTLIYFFFIFVSFRLISNTESMHTAYAFIHKYKQLYIFVFLLFIVCCWILIQYFWQEHEIKKQNSRKKCCYCCSKCFVHFERKFKFCEKCNCKYPEIISNCQIRSKLNAKVNFWYSAITRQSRIAFAYLQFCKLVCAKITFSI